jgi:hypothetical protein
LGGHLPVKYIILEVLGDPSQSFKPELSEYLHDFQGLRHGNTCDCIGLVIFGLFVWGLNINPQTQTFSLRPSLLYSLSTQHTTQKTRAYAHHCLPDARVSGSFLFYDLEHFPFSDRICSIIPNSSGLFGEVKRYE